MSPSSVTPAGSLVQPVETFSGHARSRPGSGSKQSDSHPSRRWIWIGAGAGLGALLTTVLSGYLMRGQPAPPSSGNAVETVLAPAQDIRPVKGPLEVQTPSAAAQPPAEGGEEAPVAPTASASAASTAAPSATASSLPHSPPTATTPPASHPPPPKPTPASAPPRPDDQALPRYGRE